MTKEKINSKESTQCADNTCIEEEIGGTVNEKLDTEEAAEDVNLSESTENDDNSAERVAEAEMPDAAEVWKDKYLRLAAEFDNYRKRTLREKADLIAFGGEEVIKSVLGISDDLDRAVQAIEQAREMDAVKEGVSLIIQKISDLLRNKGVSEIAALGLPFDTDLHEAVAKVPVKEKKQKGKVIDVIQKGYKLKEKVIRYPKVVVGE